VVGEKENIMCSNFDPTEENFRKKTQYQLALEFKGYIKTPIGNNTMHTTTR
jgi:hypothetical protein